MDIAERPQSGDPIEQREGDPTRVGHEAQMSSAESRVRTRLQRRTIRYVAAGLAATIALIYFLIGVGVLTVVTAVDGDQSMLVFGVSAGAVFLLGAALLFAFDRRVLWILGAVLQLFVVWGYLAVAPDRAPSFEAWGISLRILQIPLLAALVYLALRSVRSSEARLQRQF